MTNGAVKELGVILPVLRIQSQTLVSIRGLLLCSQVVNRKGGQAGLSNLLTAPPGQDKERLPSAAHNWLVPMKDSPRRPTIG